jgi:hypothetical protein
VKKLTFRNSKGDPVYIPRVAAAEVKNEDDDLESPVKARSNPLDEFGSKLDSLLVRMRTSKARKGMTSAFHASPTQLGRAAVKAARKRR